MAYKINERELYNRAFFNFDCDGILINAVFENYDEPTYDYMFIVFTEDGQPYLEEGLENKNFQDTLNEILYRFDDKRELNYKVLVTC